MKLLRDDVVQRLLEPGVTRLVVGLSGGVDSTALLHALSRQNDVSELAPLTAIHINHGLQDDADKFAATAGRTCQSLAVPLQVINVDVREGGSLESNAREARYAAFEAHLRSGDLLLLAHHADDQVETILFRLFRGSRVAGLEGMPVERPLGEARLFRPLLGIARDDIQQYAEAVGLDWNEDPSNRDASFDRNYLRHEVLPVIEARWPGVGRNLLRSLAVDIRMRATLEQAQARMLAGLSVDEALDINRLRTQFDTGIADVSGLADLLSHWIQVHGAPQPTGKVLLEAAGNVLGGRPVNIMTRELEIRSHEGRLYLLQPLSPLPLLVKAGLQEGVAEFAGGQISNRLIKGGSLRPERGLDLGWRQGGEVIRIRHQRSLKQLFQAGRYPAWLRDRVPLIYKGDELVAIGALPDWDIPMQVADGWTAAEDEKGFEIQFRAGQLSSEANFALRR